MRLHRLVADARARALWPYVAFAVVAGVASCLVYRPLNPFDPTNLPIGNGDTSQTVWILGWVAHALVHGHNPLLTRAMDLPGGANLAFNTSHPLLGILAAPITLTAGPIESFNVLIRLAPFLTALSAVAVLRAWRVPMLVASVAALAFGLCPFVIGQLGPYGHLSLVFLCFVPILVYLLDRLFIRPTGSFVRNGAWFGLVLGLEFCVSSEIFVEFAVVAVLALVPFAIAGIVTVWQPAVARAIAVALGVGLASALCSLGIFELAFRHARLSKGMAVADVLVVVLLGAGLLAFGYLRNHPGEAAVWRARYGALVAGWSSGLLAFLVVSSLLIYEILFGPDQIHTAVQATAHLQAFRNDLTGLLFRDSNELFAPHWMTQFTATLVSNYNELGGSAELDGFIGLPLLLAAIYFSDRLRSNRLVVFLATFSLIALVLSLGSRIQIDGRVTSIPLPETVFARLPFLENVVPARFSVFTALGAIAIVAIGLGSLAAGARGRSRPGLRVLGLVALSVLVFVPLVPRLPTLTEQRVLDVPDAQRVGSLIPEGSDILTWPFSLPGQEFPTILQAVDSYRFNVEGGNLYVPGQQGSTPPMLEPAYVPEELAILTAGPWRTMYFPTAQTRRRADVLLCGYVDAQRVSAVVYSATAVGSNVVYPWFRRTFGPPDHVVGRILVWSDPAATCGRSTVKTGYLRP